MENITNNLAEFATSAKYKDLPKEVVEKVKLIFLDSIGCALGSYMTDRSKIALEFALESGGNPQASIIGGYKTSSSLAAFVNGELINSLDFDVIGPLTGHVYPYVAPSCLAIAEKNHSSGKELILALALSNEIGGRIASSLSQHRILKKEPPYYEEHPRFSFSTTLIGGVTGPGNLLGFNTEKMVNAMGIAGASCPIPATQKWENLTCPATMVKYNAWAGWCAQLATVATLMAEKGFTGDPSIFDGELGFWKLVGSAVFKPENLVNELGKKWNILETAFKLYPTCQINQVGIQVLRKIIKSNNLKLEDIGQIIIKGDPLFLTPNRNTNNIKGFGDMQFSNKHIFAASILYNDFAGPLWQLPLIYKKKKLELIANKIKVELHPKTSEVLIRNIKEGTGRPFIMDVIVEVILNNGKKFISEGSAPRGSINNPASKEEIISKFRNNASFSLIDTCKIENSIKMIEKLEKLEDVNFLTKLFVID